MSWRYVPSRRTVDGEDVWEVREYYEMGPLGSPAWTLDPIAAYGDGARGLDELRQDLGRMRADIRDATHYLELDGDAPGLREIPR